MKVDFNKILKFKENFPNRKYYSLMDKIYDINTLNEAWKIVNSNKGCAGFDKQTLKEFKSNKNVHLEKLQKQLKSGRYKAPPVLRKSIPKQSGNLRMLGIPTVKDRIVQQAVKLVIEPIFENKFLDCSYGYRPNKSAILALKQIKEYWRTRYKWVLEADITSFFDEVNHEKLIQLVGIEISDGKLLSLINNWLKAGIVEDNKFMETTLGIPQGGVLSPLLANIYLHELDKYMIKKKYKFIRYADDFIVLCKTEKKVKLALKDVKQILNSLKLKLHPDKTKITRHDEIKFLGFKFGGRNFGFRPQDEAIKKFKLKIKELTNRKRTFPINEIIRVLNYIILGFANYFKFGRVGLLFKILDKYVRFRVRIYLTKKVSKLSGRKYSNYDLHARKGLKSLTNIISN